VRAYLRSLNPDLPRAVWILQGGGLANAFGNGVVLPFVIIYLHNVRGLSLTVAGLTAAVNAGAGIVSGAAGGAFADRIGPKRILIAALAGQTVVIACFPLIDNAWQALALQFAMGTFSGMFWPSQSSLLTSLTPQRSRPAAFAQQRVTMNLGIGLGGLAGGVIATTSDPGSFTTLFLLDAATFLSFALVLLRVPSPPRLRHEGPGGTYRDVLRNRPFVSFLLINLVFVTAGIVPFAEFMPVYAKNGAGVSETAIGLIFFVNTLFIVVAQLPIAKALEGRRRMPAFALMGVAWAATWVTVTVAVETLGSTAAAIAIGAAVVVFAAGECLHGAVQGPLVADLADPRLIGRYMALSSLSWQAAFFVGPAVGGAILDAQPVALWLLFAALCVVGTAWSLAFERRLPPELARTPRRSAAQVLADEDVPSGVPVQRSGVESAV
jgi:predicted MFS family arabinose efflux permease